MAVAGDLKDCLRDVLLYAQICSALRSKKWKAVKTFPSPEDRIFRELGDVITMKKSGSSYCILESSMSLLVQSMHYTCIGLNRNRS